MAVVRNRSGIDSGEIDYSIKCDRFDALSVSDLIEVRNTLMKLHEICAQQIAEITE